MMNPIIGQLRHENMAKISTKGTIVTKIKTIYSLFVLTFFFSFSSFAQADLYQDIYDYSVNNLGFDTYEEDRAFANRMIHYGKDYFSVYKEAHQFSVKNQSLQTYQDDSDFAFRMATQGQNYLKAYSKAYKFGDTEIDFSYYDELRDFSDNIAVVSAYAGKDFAQEYMKAYAQIYNSQDYIDQYQPHQIQSRANAIAIEIMAQKALENSIKQTEALNKGEPNKGDEINSSPRVSIKEQVESAKHYSEPASKTDFESRSK